MLVYDCCSSACLLLDVANSCRHCVSGRKLRRQKQRASRSDSHWVSRGYLAVDRRQTGQHDLLPCATWLRKHGHEVSRRRVLARHLLRRLPWSARRCLHCFVPRATRLGLPHRWLDQEEQLRPCEMRDRCLQLCARSLPASIYRSTAGIVATRLYVFSVTV